jgi:hypothetical protein
MGGAMQRLLLFTLVCMSGLCDAVEPPVNPALAASSWPIFHRNNYAQASGRLDSLAPGERVRVQRAPNASGGVSSWTLLLPRYSNGSQAAVGSNRHGVVKYLVNNETFEQVAFLPVPRQRFGFELNLAVLRDGSILTTSKLENAFFRVADRSPNCPNCELVVKQRVVVPKALGQITTQFSIAYDGTVISLVDGNRLIALSLDSGQVLSTLDIPVPEGDVSYHNAFPIDETGRIYLSSQTAMTAIDWRNGALRIAWTAPYDFRGPGCENVHGRSRFREALAVARGEKCTGTGTTPTLIGDRRTGIVVAVDGHAPNNRLVAFWRDAIPFDATSVAGEDRRVASILELPLSTLERGGFTAENSPAAWGNSIFVAQWLGFSPSCRGPRGVQRVDWLPDTKRLSLVWANPDAHFNGVPTVSATTGLVYGAGLAGNCELHYRGIDIDTGRIALDLPLGDKRDFLDQGNQHTITADGSILYASTGGVVRLKRMP